MVQIAGFEDSVVRRDFTLRNNAPTHLPWFLTALAAFQSMIQKLVKGLMIPIRSSADQQVFV